MTESQMLEDEKSDGTAFPESEEPVKNPRFLKGLVIFLGVLLIGGFVVVFSTIIYRAVNLPESKTGYSGAPGFEDMTIAIPVGATITSMELDGARLAVQVRSDSGEEILIVDTRQGRVLGRIRLQTGG